MQNFELTILGCSSATPTSTRNPTAQLLNIAERFFLIDCGEATQIQLRKFKLKFQRINHIFISHLHGDHYLGLVGLLSSMHLMGRTIEMHIYCPAELQEIIELQFKHSQTFLNYKIIYHPHRYINDEVIFEDDRVEVRSIVLNHRIPCSGFVFSEKQITPSITKDTIEQYDLSIENIIAIKAGADFTHQGRKIENHKLVKRCKPRKYAYASDTCYDERIIPYIKGADLLYHEATFLHDLLPRAKETFHTTALQAGLIAQKAEVSQLMLGHFSARYKDLQPLLEEAQQNFPNTVLASEGESTVLPPVIFS
ncbi:MAG TPA: ribonuclease Z [Bacteroidia bacterium]|jgi:ribonuclease Z|nr:ribonuclease Z [Bacteroidia bacterium]